MDSVVVMPSLYMIIKTPAQLNMSFTQSYSFFYPRLAVKYFIYILFQKVHTVLAFRNFLYRAVSYNAFYN